MVDPALAATPGPGATAPFPRAYLPWLVLLLAVHAGILAVAVSDALAAPAPYYRPEGYLRAGLIALVVFGAAVALRGRYTRAIAWNGGILVASALLTPAVVLVVGLQLLNAYVIGHRVLARTDLPGATAGVPHVAIAILIGACVGIGLISIAAPFRVHSGPVYASVLILPLIFWWRTSAAALRAAGRTLVRRGSPTSASERSWTVLLMTIVTLHLFIVAKPEVGYDAMAMHLQLPLLMADAQRWSFDVTRYVWAVMPLGSDWAYTVAYLMGGEGAARFLNFCFAGLACLLVFELIRLYARRDIALASVCLFASSPFAFLETGTLYVENLWLAFLLGTLLQALAYLRTPANRTLIGLAFLAAGAMQCKVIGVIWLVPLLLYTGYVAWRRRAHREFTARELALLAVAVTLAAWPYANAWARTGNPVFPFMNALFKSPLFDTATSFNNPLYNAALRPWSIYELISSSGKFIEGSDGAAGLQWLLLFPVIALAFTRRRPLAQWLCLALAALFFVGVFTQQSYIRYLLPAFALIAVLGGWAIAAIPDGRATRIALLVIGGILCAVNVRLIYSAAWFNFTLCTACATDARARYEYLAQYAPERIAGDYLNRNLPRARVGFYLLGGTPGGYVGYSRVASWHDVPTYGALATAQTADDVLAHARKFRLTHIVYRDPPYEWENAAMKAFREQFTVPVWRANGVVVAEIRPAPSR